MSIKARMMDDFRKRENTDLEMALEERRRECFNIRFQQASEKATNPQRLRALRKEVARIMTVLRERRLAEKGEE